MGLFIIVKLKLLIGDRTDENERTTQLCRENSLEDTDYVQLGASDGAENERWMQ
jgi:hypothetical protein